MSFEATSLPGCLLFRPRVFEDARGHFFESWNRLSFLAHGLDPVFVQGNVSLSTRGVLRGLHYQWPNAQGKFVTVSSGEVFDVAVDLRRGSPTFGKWLGVTLSEENRQGLWIPPGFAHGFLATSNSATFTYLVTAPYDRDAEVSLRWNDPAIGIEWPGGEPILSAKDAAAPSLSELSVDRIPRLEQCAPS